MRRRFLKYLLREVFKIPWGQQAPRCLLFLKAVLFPIESIYGRINNYDWQTDSYTFFGIRYSAELFEAWGEGGLPEGTIFRLVKRENGMVTIEKLLDKDEDSLTL